jgi:hypothetical protein
MEMRLIAANANYSYGEPGADIQSTEPPVVLLPQKDVKLADQTCFMTRR